MITRRYFLSLSLSFITRKRQEKRKIVFEYRSQTRTIYFYIICFSMGKKRIPLSDGILLRALQFWNTATEIGPTHAPSPSFIPLVYVIFSRFQLHFSLIFPSLPSPLCASMNFAQVYKGEKERILFLLSRNRILTRRTTIRDFSRLSKIPARIISSVSPLQFQTVWNNDESEEREREREREDLLLKVCGIRFVFWWESFEEND